MLKFRVIEMHKYLFTNLQNDLGITNQCKMVYVNRFECFYVMGIYTETTYPS